LQWIELQRDPLGVSDRNGKPHIRAGGNKLKVTSALQSLDDKIRIATKVRLYTVHSITLSEFGY
jgi:hypothetical protein